MVLSIVLSGVCVVIAEQLVIEPATVTSEYGGIGQLDDGSFVGCGADQNGSVTWSQGSAYGEFTVYHDEHQRGWPYPSRRDDQPIRLDVNVYGETGVRRDVALKPDDPLRRALAALVRAGPAHPSEPDYVVLAQWLDGNSDRAGDRRSWHATIAGAITWIGLLLGVQLVLIGIARITTRYARIHLHGRRKERASDGRCHHCGYDLRGLEFTDRCPECGTLVV